MVAFRRVTTADVFQSCLGRTQVGGVEASLGTITTTLFRTRVVQHLSEAEIQMRSVCCADGERRPAREVLTEIEDGSLAHLQDERTTRIHLPCVGNLSVGAAIVLGPLIDNDFLWQSNQVGAYPHRMVGHGAQFAHTDGSSRS